jgi:hypothetical protein
MMETMTQIAARFPREELDPGHARCERIVEQEGRFYGGGISDHWTVRVRGRTYRASTKPLVICEAARSLRDRIATGELGL